MSGQNPNDRKYTKDHEWAKLDSDTVAIVGITHHAQEALGEVVFVETPKKGRVVKKGEAIGVVESIKAVSDIYAPLSGTIIESHAELADSPTTLNEDPYNKGWMFKIELADRSEIDALLSSEQYQSTIS